MNKENLHLAWVVSRKNVVRKALAITFVIYLLEIIIGGPGQWQIGELLPIRHILFFLLASLYLLDVIVNSPIKEDIYVISWIGVLFSIWGILLPQLHQIPAEHAFIDGRPLGTLIVVPIVLRLIKESTISVSDLVRLIFFASAIVVVLHVCFGIYLYLNGHRLGQDAAEYFFCFHTQCPGIYVGNMPGGGIRVHWIGSIFLLSFLAEIIVRRSSSWTLLWSIAFYLSWSRSLWIACILVVIGMMIALKKQFPWHLLLVAFLTIIITDKLLTVNITHSSVSDVEKSLMVERFGQEGGEVRMNQVLSHFRMFSLHPFLGAGFGAPSDVIRSKEAPWSSESTYTSLLYKLGILGGIIFMMPVLILFRRLRSRRFQLEPYQKIFIAVGMGFLFMSAFNPYLMNAVGLTFIALIYALIWRESKCHH